MDFDNNSRDIYLQIADAICDRVLSGELSADQRIPSVREYAAQVAVNVNTVMRSYDYLSGLGIIYNKRGLGYFTAPDAKATITGLRRRRLLDEGMPAVFRQLALLDITPDALAGMYEEYIRNNQTSSNS